MNNRNNIQHEIATGVATLPVAVIISLLLWGLTLRQYTDLATLAATCAVAYLLIELNTRFAIIRTRTALPAALYLLFTAADPALHTHTACTWLPLLFMGTIHSLSRSFETARASATVFNAFCFTGLAGLLLPQSLCLVPLMLVSMIQLRSLTLRTFFAALTGLALPYWLLAGLCSVTGRMDTLLLPFTELAAMQLPRYSAVAPHQWAYWSVITAISAVSAVQSLRHARRDKVQTRIILQVTATLQTGTTLLFLVQPHLYAALLPLQLIVCALMSGYYLALVYDKFSYWFARIALLLWTAATAANLWLSLTHP